MPLVVTYNENTGGGNGAWQNAPIGIHKATCCDVVDLGTLETEYGPKHQCEIHFELDKETAGLVEATGNQFTVRTQRFNLPEPGHDLSEKSNLYKFLCSWRGRRSMRLRLWAQMVRESRAWRQKLMLLMLMEKQVFQGISKVFQ